MPPLRYDCVIEAAQELGWRIVCEREKDVTLLDDPECDFCNVYWIDVANIAERMSKLRPWQRINHFPGMSNIARKNRLAQNLEKMRREYPKEYSFYPRTWVLPLELADFRAQFDSTGRSSRFYIVKPDSGCQGRGIFLTQNFDSISPLEQVVAQHYIRKPFLIDGFKFDLRLYVLITSCKPLRMYLFHDGLVRLCTEEYLKPNAENVAMRCMHLTNYAINKHNENFQSNENVDAGDVGSKRSLRWFMDYIAGEKGQVKADSLWRRMGTMSVKVIISILPTLVREYESTFFRGAGGLERCAAEPKRPSCDQGSTKSDAPAVYEETLKGSKLARRRVVEGSRCFEVLGVDIIVDHALKPWLVEVNHLPSFATDSPLDLDIKSRVIEQTMSIVKAKANDRFVYEEAERSRAEERLYNSQPTSLPMANLVQEGVLLSQTRRRIEDVLRRHAPEKLVKVSALLQKYVGREDKLVRLVERKYLTNSTTSVSIPPTNSAEQGHFGRSTPSAHSDDGDDVDGSQGKPWSTRVGGKRPPLNQPNEDATDSDIELEDQLLVDFDRIYPVPSEIRKRNLQIPDYKALTQFVFAQDEKRIKRLSCPLRQNRGSALDFAESLPPLNDSMKDTKDGRIPWGDPFRRHGEAQLGKSFSLAERKPLPMPGQKQAAAADRLTRGFSSRQHTSAPSSLGHLPDDTDMCQIGDYTQKVANTVAHAKEWRRRMDDVRNRRNHGQVALQPKTFIFAQTNSPGYACLATPAVSAQQQKVGVRAYLPA